MASPYKTTQTFDQDTLPPALRREHRTKAGVWGLIRVLEGRLLLHHSDDGSEQVLTPEAPGLIKPEQPHFVQPLGVMRMQVEFYSSPPA